MSKLFRLLFTFALVASYTSHVSAHANAKLEYESRGKGVVYGSKEDMNPADITNWQTSSSNALNANGAPGQATQPPSSGTIYFLYAQPYDGNTFVGWAEIDAPDAELISTEPKLQRSHPGTTDEVNTYAIFRGNKATEHNINVATGIEGGTIAADATSALQYTKINITATPDEGYKLQSVSVKDADNREVTVKDNSYFLMAGSDVTVAATFVPSFVNDTLTYTGLGMTGTTQYADFEGKQFNSTAVYAGHAASGNNSIQIRTTNNNAGVVTTKSGGKLLGVTLEFNSNTNSTRAVDVYGKEEPYTQATDLYNTATQGTKLGTIYFDPESPKTISVSGDYKHVGFRSTNGALYLDKAIISWEPGEFLLDITEDNFPDAELRRYLTTDTVNIKKYGADGVFTQAELDDINTITLDSAQSSGNYTVASLQGLHHFAKLNTLNLYGQQIPDIDLTQNAAITMLSVRNNGVITGIELSQNQNISSLEMINNDALATLDVSNNAKLARLLVHNNAALTALKVSGNPRIETLSIYENALADTLDATDMPRLTAISAYHNRLKAVSIDNSPNITGIAVNGNEIEHIDVSNNTALRSLNVSDNKLKTLNVSNNTQLTSLTASGNRIAEADLTQLTALTTLRLENNALTALDLSKQNNIGVLFNMANAYASPQTAYIDPVDIANGTKIAIPLSKGAQAQRISNLTIDGRNATPEITVEDGISYLVLGNKADGDDFYNQRISYSYDTQLPVGNEQNKIMKVTVITATDPDAGTLYINQQTVPDSALRNFMLNAEWGKDGVVSTNEIYDIYSLDIAKKGIKDLKGIEYFKKLEILYAQENELQHADLSKNRLLYEVRLNDNRLTELHLLHNDSLQRLYLGGNLFEKLDLKEAPNLIWLFAENNLLTSIDLSANNKLTTLRLTGNRLACIDLSALPGAGTNIVIGNQQWTGKLVALNNRQQIAINLTGNVNTADIYNVTANGQNYNSPTILENNGGYYFLLAEEKNTSQPDIDTYNKPLSYVYRATTGNGQIATMNVKVMCNDVALHIDDICRDNNFYAGSFYHALPTRLPQGMEAYVASGLTIDKKRLQMTQIDNIPAYTAVYVRTPQTGFHIMEAVDNNNTVDQQPLDNLLLGTLADSTIADGTALQLDHNVRTGELGFWNFNHYGSIPAHRAYIKASFLNQTNATDGLLINIGEDTTTGIVDVNGNENANVNWYSLDGQRLSRRPTQPGIYIHDGRQIVIR